MVWVGLFQLSGAGALGLAALDMCRTALGHATREARSTALLTWIVCVLSPMLVTRLAWGQIPAWNEPRVKATGRILLTASVLSVVSRLVNHGDFYLLDNGVMGIAPWVVIASVVVIRHPVGAIGGSNSLAIHASYLLIPLTMAGLAATLIARLWAGIERGVMNGDGALGSAGCRCDTCMGAWPQFGHAGWMYREGRGQGCAQWICAPLRPESEESGQCIP